MLELDFLKNMIAISIALSTITCALIQKSKSLFKCSKYLPLYSLFINILIGIVFCYTFTKIDFPTSIWVGLFSFIGADSLYKTLEGKLSSYTDIVSKNSVAIPKENIINKGDSNGKTNISK